MIRYLLIAALFLAPAASLSIPAHAQLAAVPAAPAQTPPSPAADPAQVKALVQTLKDPVAREKLIQQLNLLSQQQAAQKPADSDPLGSRILKFLSARVTEAGDEFGALGRAFIGLPSAERWFRRQLSAPATRAHWGELVASLAMVLAAGAAAFALAYFAIRRPRRSLERRRSKGTASKLVVGILRLLLRLIPIGLFGFVGYSLLSLIKAPMVVSLATLAIINAVLLALTVVAASRFLLSPLVSGLRLVPVSDKAAKFMHRWICWIGVIAAFGCFGVSALQMLGLPRVAAHGALKLIGFVILVILVSLVTGRRRAVARWIRGERDAGAQTTRGASVIWSARQRLSEVWHLLVVAYLVATFAVWAFDVQGGFTYILRATVISVLIVVGARLAVRLVAHGLARGMALSDGQVERFPQLRRRADRYLPIIRSSTSLIVWLAAFIALVDIWGLSSVEWFEGPAGRDLLGRIASIAFVMVAAVVAWEFVSAIIEGYLLGAVRDGSQVQRGQRVRTLLPLLRNIFLIFLIVIVVLIILSEIGLNITPLLAGAGVVGLAIGFGAQTLVKDVITGIFILFENTIAVGDVVDVGGGHSGLVENFSIRTLKLRDSSGGVHTVPFSAVTSVNNMTKDFAYYVFNIKVDYAQDSDKVVEAVTALGKELQNDMAFCDLILAPIEIVGLDSFGPDAAILQARFKTKPIKQWTVGREFNRRMKKRFDELGIPLTFPQSMVLLPAAKPGAGPAPDAA